MDESTSPRVALSRADKGARLWALLIDLTLLGLAAIIAMFGTVMASAPFWDVNGQTHPTAGAGSAVLALDETVPKWVSWVVVAILAGAAVLISGALKSPGRRRSLGLTFAELCLVRAGADADTDAALDAGLDSGHAWDPASAAPAKWRVAARWLLPLATFAVLAPFTGGFLAGVVTFGGWAPALVGSRRSVYDRITGVVVVDPVRSIRRGQDAAKARRRALRR